MDTYTQPVTYAFGEFRLDARRRLLRYTDDDQVVELTPKAFDVLLYLASRTGQVVTKQELLDAIWPEVIVEENNLTQTISALRKALGERPRDHRYITTVTGTGYQFVAPVREVSLLEEQRQPAPEDSQIHPSVGKPGMSDVVEITPGRSGQVVWRRIGIVFLALLLAGLIVTLVLDHSGGAGNEAQQAAGFQVTESRLLPGPAGSNTQPTLSPDGSRAAFVSDAGGTPQIYVQYLGRGAARQLTEIPGGASMPSWSPRNDEILFQRGRQGIWSVDPLGTLAPRMLVRDGVNPSMAWDGAEIAYEWDQELRIAKVDGSEPRAITGVPRSIHHYAAAFPRLSPDGTEVVYFRQEAGPLGDYWIVPVSGGQPRRLTFDVQWGGKPAWTPNGKFIVFPSKRGGSVNLWRIPSSGGTPEPVTTGLGEDRDPVISHDGRRMLYTTTRIEVFFMVTDPATGRDEVLYSNRRNFVFPRVSPDGRRIVFFAEFEPREQIFLMNVDGTGITQLTRYRSDEANIMPRWGPDGETVYYYQDLAPVALRKLDLAGGASEVEFNEFRWELNMDVEWSPDGSRIAYVRIDPGTRERRIAVRRLRDGSETLLDPAIRYSPSWSRDGRFVLGTSVDRVLLCPTDGGSCSVIADGSSEPGGFGVTDPESGPYAQWSWDHSRIFYVRRTPVRGRLSLWTVNRNGTGHRQLLEFGPVHPLANRFQVLPGDRILWCRYDQANTEIVVATLSQSDSAP